jgi:hypothetical protein
MISVALFISGRLTCYEDTLIPLLRFLDYKYNINLFCSINGEQDDYHLEAERNLAKWLRKITYEIYKVPESFVQNTHPETLFQNINGQKVPYTVLSCFYNDRKAFNLIDSYEKETGKIFDVISKIRPDLIFRDYNNIIFKKDSPDDLLLHTCIPLQPIYIYGYESVPMCICDAFAYGNRKVMEIYTRTYEYILNENKKRNGNFRINYEPSLTESIINFYFLDTKNENEMRFKYLENEREIIFDFFYCPYFHNSKRRDRDIVRNPHNF